MLTTDGSQLVRVARVVPDDIGDDLQRFPRHRQNPTPGVEQPANQVETGDGPVQEVPEGDDEQVAERVTGETPLPPNRCWSTSRHWWPQSLSSQRAEIAIRRSPGQDVELSRSRPEDPRRRPP